MISGVVLSADSASEVHLVVRRDFGSLEIGNLELLVENSSS